MASKISVLIIDDDEDGRFTLSRFLKKIDTFTIRIMEAETGEEGLAMFREHMPDVVLLDYSLPGICGIDALKAIREHDPQASVVMLTGFGSEEVAVQVMKLGATDYLPKDRVNFEAVERTVSRAVEHGELVRKIAQQKADLENFVNIIAHDLQTPLGGITGFAQLLLLKAETDSALAKHTEELTYMLKSATHMSELINALQAYAHGNDEVPFSEVSLKEAVEQAIANISVNIKEHAATVDIADSYPTVTGNKSQLVQLLQNLMANGIKYCNGHAPRIIVSCAADPDKVTLTVSDNGIGIPEDKLTDIFAPFVRLHKTEELFQGTGLGLATCKRIVDRHGGTIKCTSTVGVGSQFHITLPR